MGATLFFPIQIIAKKLFNKNGEKMLTKINNCMYI